MLGDIGRQLVQVGVQVDVHGLEIMTSECLGVRVVLFILRAVDTETTLLFLKL